MIDREELVTWLQCPACQQPLRAVGHCEACGTRYPEVDRRPALIAPAAYREVTFPFTARRSTAGEDFRVALSYPARRGAAGTGHPYHLDLAHLDVIERLGADARILEIGCGGAQMRSFIAARGCRYVGIDISVTRVEEALRAYGGPDLLADSHFLPFRSGLFDAVYSAAVTEHLACPFQAAQEIARVLKPGGYYLGNVSFLEPWHDDSFFHMSPLGVYELLIQAGFEIRHIWPGWGYSGYRALLAMGNRVTRPIAFVGDALFRVYWSGRTLRRLLRGSVDDDGKSEIAEAARVSGATDWIARKPLAAAGAGPDVV